MGLDWRGTCLLVPWARELTQNSKGLGFGLRVAGKTLFPRCEPGFDPKLGVRGAKPLATRTGAAVERAPQPSETVPHCCPASRASRACKTEHTSHCRRSLRPQPNPAEPEPTMGAWGSGPRTPGFGQDPFFRRI